MRRKTAHGFMNLFVMSRWRRWAKSIIMWSGRKGDFKKMNVVTWTMIVYVANHSEQLPPTRPSAVFI